MKNNKMKIFIWMKKILNRAKLKLNFYVVDQRKIAAFPNEVRSYMSRTRKIIFDDLFNERLKIHQ